MRSKLAVWSWIMPIIGLALFISYLLLSIVIEELAPIIILGSTGLGLIFGIVALRRISRNHKLTGKGHATIGTILNAILFTVWLLFFVLLWSFAG